LTSSEMSLTTRVFRSLFPAESAFKKQQEESAKAKIISRDNILN